MATQINNKPSVRTRTISFAVLVGLLTGFLVLLNSVSLPGIRDAHIIRETVSIMLAAFVAAVMLSRFHSRKSNLFLFLGSGFMGTAALEIFHLLVASQTVGNDFPSSLAALTSWSWLAGRVFLSILWWLSLVAWRQEVKSDRIWQIDERWVYLVVGMLIPAIFILFQFVLLPRAYYPEYFFSRPEELIAGFFFLMTLVGYWRKGGWRDDLFEYFLVLALIVSVFDQMLVSSTSRQLFDQFSNAAHGLKNLSYLLVLIGSLADMYLLFQQIEERTQAEREHRKLAEVLGDTAALLTSTLHIEQVLDRILENISHVVPHDTANIMLVEAGVARVVGQRGYDRFGVEKAIMQIRYVIDETDGLRIMANSGQPLVISQVKAYPGWKVSEVSAWINAYAGAPIRSGEKVIGFLNVDSAIPDFFTEVHVQRLQAFADQAAIAIRNARLYERSKRQATQLEALRKVTLDVTAQLDLNSLLYTLIENVLKLLDTNRGGIYLYDSEHDRLEWSVSIGSEEPLGTVVQCGEGLSGRVWESGQPLIVRNYGNWEGQLSLPGREKLVSAFILGVPIRWGTEFMGVINIVAHPPRPEFSEEDIDLVTLFADQAAIAIQNARLFAQASESEQRYRQIFENTGDLVWTSDAYGNCFRFNRRARELFGFPNEDIEGGRVWQAVVPEHRERAQGFYQRLFQERRVKGNVEFPMMAADGRTLWLDQNVSAHIEDGVVLSFQGIMRDVTDRKHAEEALQQANTLLMQERSLFVSGPVVVFKWRSQPGWPVEYVSPNVAGVLGYSEQEFMSGKVSFAEIVFEDDIRRVTKEVVANSQRGAGNFEHEPYRVIRKDGETLWIADYTTMVRDDQGDITHYLGYIVDITERRRAEEALRSREAQYRSLVENNPDYIVVIDPEYTVQFVNSLAEGVTMDQVLGNSALNFVPPEYQETAKQTFQVVLAGGDFARYQTPSMRRDGSPGWLDVRVTPIREDEQVVGLTLTMTDITELKQAEQALRESEERYRTLLEASREAILLSEQGKTLDVNPAFEKIFAYKRSETIGMSVLDFVGLQSLEMVTRYVNEGFKGPYEAFGRRGDGTEFPVDVRVQHIHYKGHSVRVATIRDLTAQKQAEQALRESEEKYRNIFENAEVGVFRTKIDGSAVLDVNRKLTQMIGFSKEELLVSSSVIHWANPEQRSVMLELLQKHGRVTDFEFDAVRKNGEIVTLLGSMRLYPERGYIEGTLYDITERKQAEQALRESEEKYRNIFEKAEVGVFRTKLDGSTILDVNEKLTQMLGFPKEELLNLHSAIRWVNPSDWEVMVDLLSAHGSVADFEFDALTKSGETVTLLSSMKLFQEQGYIEGTLMDITARKQAEKALQATLTRTEVLYSVSRALINFKDLPTTLKMIAGYIVEVLSANGVLIITFDIENKNIHHFIKSGPGIGHIDCPTYDELEEGLSGWVIRENQPALSPKGTPDPRENIALQQRRINNNAGDIIVVPLHYRGTMLGTVTAINIPNGPDFTEEDVNLMVALANQTASILKDARLLQELRESEERLRSTFESLDDLVFSLNEQGIFNSYYQPAGNPNLYVPPDVFIGRHFKDVLPLHVVQPLEDAIIAAASVFQVQQFDYSLQINGEERWFSANVSVRKGSEGEFAGVTVAARDITWRRQAEIRQAETLKELEAKNQELKDFAHIVSHDLKAPLRGVASLANWLAEDYMGKLDTEGQEMIAMLVGRVERMYQLINGILQYSRIGRVTEDKTWVDLNKVVYGTIDLLMPPKNIKIAVVGKLPKVYFGITQIEQVFQNLIGNAIKYMDKPQGEIQVACVKQNGYWQFSIADNGPGIEGKYFDKVFQIFQTLNARDEVESTGVGLPIVKKIIELQGGKIWVESEVGVGSTFYFTIPTK